MNPTENEAPSLFRLSWPLVLHVLFTMVGLLASSIIINQYSNNAGAAVSVSNQVMVVGYDFSAIIAIGAAIWIAQLIGAGQRDTARRFAANALSGAALLSLILSVVVWPFLPMLLKLVNTPEEIHADAMIYIRISMLSMIGNSLITCGAAVLKSFGKTKDILLLGILANVLGLVSSYVLVFGHWGFPELGIRGAAYATLIVRVIGPLLILIVIAKRLRVNFLTSLKSLFPDTLKMSRLALPVTIESLTFNFHQLVLLALIGTLGVASILSRSYALTLTSLVTLFTYAIMQANDVLVGYAQGGAHTEEAYKRGLKTCAINIGIAALICILLALFARPLLLLLTDQEEVIQLATRLLWIAVILIPLESVHGILFNSLKSAGVTISPVIWNLCVGWLISLPLAYLFIRKLGWGLEAIWIARIFEEALKAGFMFFMWRRRKWTKNRLVA